MGAILCVLCYIHANKTCVENKGSTSFRKYLLTIFRGCVLAALAEVCAVTVCLGGLETAPVDVCEWLTRRHSLVFSTSQCWEAPNNKVKTAVIATVAVPALCCVQAAVH